LFLLRFLFSADNKLLTPPFEEAQMNTERIKQFIDEALKHEQETCQLHNILQDRLPTVERVVRLPEEQAQEKLYQFVLKYIQQVPQMMEDLHYGAVEAGLTSYVLPIINVVQSFFEKTSEQLDGSAGMFMLMDKAFLAHRLFEEVNDTYIMQVGQPMIPFDMTMSNVIVHSLIGEPFANDLDQMVFVAVDELFGPQQAYNSEQFLAFMDKKQSDNLVHIAQRWPCMSSQMGIDGMKFG